MRTSAFYAILVQFVVCAYGFSLRTAVSLPEDVTNTESYGSTVPEPDENETCTMLMIDAYGVNSLGFYLPSQLPKYGCYCIGSKGHLMGSCPGWTVLDNMPDGFYFNLSTDKNSKMCTTTITIHDMRDFGNNTSLFLNIECSLNGTTQARRVERRKVANAYSCETGQDCLYDDQECKGNWLRKTCSCPFPRRVFDDGHCYTGVPLNESCNNTAQCQSLDPNSQCVSQNHTDICKCRWPFFIDNMRCQFPSVPTPPYIPPIIPVFPTIHVPRTNYTPHYAVGGGVGFILVFGGFGVCGRRRRAARVTRGSTAALIQHPHVQTSEAPAPVVWDAPPSYQEVTKK